MKISGPSLLPNRAWCANLQLTQLTCKHTNELYNMTPCWKSKTYLQDGLTGVGDPNSQPSFHGIAPQLRRIGLQPLLLASSCKNKPYLIPTMKNELDFAHLQLLFGLHSNHLSSLTTLGHRQSDPADPIRRPSLFLGAPSLSMLLWCFKLILPSVVDTHGVSVPPFRRPGRFGGWMESKWTRSAWGRRSEKSLNKAGAFS